MGFFSPMVFDLLLPKGGRLILACSCFVPASESLGWRHSGIWMTPELDPQKIPARLGGGVCGGGGLLSPMISSRSPSSTDVGLGGGDLLVVGKEAFHDSGRGLIRPELPCCMECNNTGGLRVTVPIIRINLSRGFP